MKKIKLGKNRTIGLFTFECQKSYLCENIDEAIKLFKKDMLKNKSHFVIVQHNYDTIQIKCNNVKVLKRK